MDTTVRFYHGVLGHAGGGHPLGRADAPLLLRDRGRRTRWPSSSGRGSEVDTESIAKPAGIPPTFPAQFDHLSFNLPDEQALIDLQARLRAHDVEVTEVVDHGIMRSIYFTDPNGIALEASWWVIDPTGRDAAYDGTATGCSPTPTRCPPCASWPPPASWPGRRPPGWSTPVPTRPERTRASRERGGTCVPNPYADAAPSCEQVDQAMTRFLKPAMPRQVSKHDEADHHRVDGQQAHVGLRWSARPGSPR